MASTNGYMRFFPYDEPYPNQREAMDRIANSLHRGQDVLFEGACGTGKTLAALAPALDHARETDRTVVITTNVHQQMRQFVHEARAIAETEDLRAVVFRGKGSMCHIDVGYQECQALRDNTHEVVELESEVSQLERRQRELLETAQSGDSTASKAEASEARGDVMEALEAAEVDLAEARDAATCEHYLANCTGENADFFAWLYDDVRTPDEIYEYADERGLCGYELLKEGIADVDLVVCNYHHLLDPNIREHFFRWLDREPEEIIAVFDEAHNLEDAARDHATRTLAERTLESAIDECEEVEDPRSDRAANVLGAFADALLDTYDEAFDFGERERVGEDWYDLAIDNEDGRDDLFLAFLEAYSGSGIDTDLEAAEALGRELDEAYEEAYRNGETSVRKESSTLGAARFVRAYKDEGDAPGEYPVVAVRREATTDELVGRAELYQCLPMAVTSSLLDSLGANVLMSATLRPFDVTEAVLGLEDPVALAYPLAFPPERRRTIAVETPALFASKRDDPDVQADVSDALAHTIRFTPGNVLAFFPSYSEARRYHRLLADRVAADCYLDEPATRADELREQVTAHDNAVLFTSLWGTLAEGVSFDGGDARAAVVVGVPYPHLDERSEAVQDAYAEAFADRGEDPGWEFAVEVPTVRKTRQALGRVVRGPEDFGVRVLLDERYTAHGEAEMGKFAVRGSFPSEEREELVDVDPEKLKFSLLNFFTDLEAYPGEPPQP